MSRKGYTTVALPNTLIYQIEEVLKIKKFGYVSKPELIKESIRDKLRQLKYT